ncbi:hypothetical protein HOB87_05220 [Candidatus Woesearchaeota archaeon]|jgi:predicted HTH transcriptional regulator|nr:hypothetical protein [Candidatus Woesearchaeota archaeon]
MLPEENKTQNISEPETTTENQPVATASPEIENKIEIPTETVPENEKKIEAEPEIEPETKKETKAQPSAQEITPPIAETPKKEVGTTPTPQTQTIEKIVYKTDPNFIQKLLNKARAKIQERKRKKLDKIMTLFNTNPQITNQDIQKLLRTSRVSAFRYLNILEQENRIKQVGNTGKSVFYTKI